jgi:hypothetical protein
MVREVYGGLFIGSLGNEPFGSRPESGTSLIASILRHPPGEVPEGKAGARLQSMSRCARAHSKAAAGTGLYRPERPEGTFSIGKDSGTRPGVRRPGHQRTGEGRT